VYQQDKTVTAVVGQKVDSLGKDGILTFEQSKGEILVWRLVLNHVNPWHLVPSPLAKPLMHFFPSSAMLLSYEIFITNADCSRSSEIWSSLMGVPCFSGPTSEFVSLVGIGVVLYPAAPFTSTASWPRT